VQVCYRRRFTVHSTYRLPTADDALSEADETFTIALTADAATLMSNMQIALGAAATITITDNDAISAMSMTLRGPATLNEESSAVFTVDLGAVVTGSSVTVMIGDTCTACTPTAGDHSSPGGNWLGPAGPRRWRRNSWPPAMPPASVI